jgi:hypothetical protein
MNERTPGQSQSGSLAAGGRTGWTEASNGDLGLLMDADHAVRSFVAEHPFAAVGFALAAGYLIGRAINAAR